MAYKICTILLCAALLFTACKTRTEPDTERTPSEVERVGDAELPQAEALPPDPGNTGIDAVTAHVDFAAATELVIARPTAAIETAAEGYYITGRADPAQDLLLDGEPVEARGALGTFGVFAPLEEGENTFTFTQGEVSETVTITRGALEEYSLTDKATRMRPELDVAARSGVEYSLSCVAPSGATVTAQAGGTTVALEQAAATAVEGVPATFTGSFTPDNKGGTVDLGVIEYTVTYDGETNTYPSEGRLFVVAADADLVVHGRYACATTFTEDSADSDFYAELPGGAVDVVEEIGSSMYKLGMGGWVYKETVIPVTEPTEWRNTVDAATLEAGDSRETLTLHGTAPVPYRASWGEDGVYRITLFHTTGVGEIDVSGSELLESVTAAEKDGDTILSFRYAAGATPFGYLVSYDGANTVITLNRPPQLSQDENLPLAGLTIALDPGHGGSDTGAPGAAFDEGPLEKDVNLATALAVQQYLRGLGASVILTREGDDYVDRSARQELLRSAGIDLAVSLHSNSVEPTRDGTDPSGTETYYYDPLSERLAEEINAALCAATGRKDRGAKHSYFWITLNSYVPAVMVEMGFITNPVEYDQMCSREGIYSTAEAVAEGILAALQPASSQDAAAA